MLQFYTYDNIGIRGKKEDDDENEELLDRIIELTGGRNKGKN